jgi:phospholipase C
MKQIKLFASLLIFLSVVAPVFEATSVYASQSGTTPNTPIEHLIVVMQQNHTFDNYFGTYPGANGIPKDVCIPASLSNHKASCVAPFKITMIQSVT